MALAPSWLSNIICKICPRPRPHLAVQNEWAYLVFLGTKEGLKPVHFISHACWLIHLYKVDFSELPGIFVAPDGKCSMSGVINALGTKKNAPSYLLHVVCSKSTCSTFLIITYTLEVHKQNHFLCFQFKAPIAGETCSHMVYTHHDFSPHWHDIAPNWMTTLRALSFPLAFGDQKSSKNGQGMSDSRSETHLYAFF